MRKRSRLTLRLRLTVVYGGLFMLAGIVLLALTYLLVQQRLQPEPGPVVQYQQRDGAVPSALPSTPPSVPSDMAGKGGNTAYIYDIVEKAQKETLNTLITQGAIALLVVGAVAIALGWLIAGRLLQPLHRVTETARRIADAPAADRGLHERIALTGPHDEVKELGDTFDVMLERLDKSFDGQRRFIANASHELRTPLTLNRALLEVAVHRSGASVEVRQLGETLLEVNARHERLIDGLLLLVRSDREIAERSFVDLADIVEHVAEVTPPGKAAVSAAPEEAPTLGDSVLLERMVQNLVENGVRYNVAVDGWVRVRSGPGPEGGGTVEVEVSNTGPVVPKYEVGALFEPFRRLHAERLAASSPGAGLGLSIVRAIARAHGGDVRAEARDGGGLVVTVSLPAADAPG